jgi:hypothetical protein
MGTRADFYVGRGENAEWLGSIGWDGYPDNDDYALIFASAEERQFRLSVGELLGRRDDGTFPEHGWPWPWESSHTTDCAYAFDGGEIYLSRFGRRWVPVSEYLGWGDSDTPEREAYDEGPDDVADVPNMKDRQNVTFGERSGMTVLGIDAAGGLRVQDDKGELDEQKEQA